MKSVKMTNVLVEYKFELPKEFYVWADEGQKEKIESVEGVLYAHRSEKTRYKVGVDPRYLFDTVVYGVLTALR